MTSVIYLIGSLENPYIEDLAVKLRSKFPDVEFFDEWRGAGEAADKAFNAYRKKRNLSYREALKTYGARHIFDFDREHLDRADTVVLVMPAGKSGHLELGYSIGRGKKGYVLFQEEPDRIDQMLQFAIYSGGDLLFSEEELFSELSNDVSSLRHDRLRDNGTAIPLSERRP